MIFSAKIEKNSFKIKKYFRFLNFKISVGKNIKTVHFFIKLYVLQVVQIRIKNQLNLRMVFT